MTELSDLITEANRERGLSTREIEADATKRGHKLSHSTAGKILNGTHGRVSQDSVRALEAVFGIHRDKISKAAGLLPIGERYEPPSESSMLTERQRLAITELILSIVSEGGMAHGNAAPSKTPDPGPADQPGKDELDERRGRRKPQVQKRAARETTEPPPQE